MSCQNVCTLDLGQAVDVDASETSSAPGGTIIVASSNRDFVQEMMRNLPLTDQSIRTERTFDAAKNAALNHPNDLIVSDVSFNDTWEDGAFRWFDEMASERPIIIICRTAQQTLTLRSRALHLNEIYPMAAAKDYRFCFILAAAWLRYECVGDKAKGSVPSSGIGDLI